MMLEVLLAVKARNKNEFHIRMTGKLMMVSRVVILILIFIATSSLTLAAQTYNSGTYGSGAYGKAVCGDSVCDASESCSSCSSDCGSCATSVASSGGGGGGGSFARFFGEGTVSAHIWNSIKAGSTATMKINKKDISFTQLDITLINDARIIEIKVEKLDNNPAEPTETKVYQYLSVDKVNIEDSDISKVIFKFDVDEKWLKDNNVDKNNIVLKVFRNDEWKDLPTKLIPKNKVMDIISNSVSYEAESITLSYFAIGVKSGVEVEEEAPEEVLEEVPPEEAPPTPVEKPKPIEVPTKAPVAWIIVAVVVILGIILIVLYQKKKPQGKKTKFEKISNSKSKELDNYIEISLSKGYSKRKIKKELIQSGWPRDIVEKELEKIK